MSGELDIQDIAEKLIARFQDQSRQYVEYAERAKWMAAGARELHDAIRREAERVSTSNSGDGDND